MFRKAPLAVAVSTMIAGGFTGATAAQNAERSAASPGVLEEVMVTATRREASLQEVPMTVTAITAEDVQTYNIFRFDDLQQLSPGLALDSQGAFGSAASLRGVGFDSNSSADPAVDIYINETPVDANYAFQSIYDIGQVEVLRGPQGILRGRPSPAGAITLTTRRPDLDALGGSISGAFGNEGTVNGQATLNLPIIENKLALRLAGLYDEDEGNHVESVNSNASSERETTSWRTSLRWAPTDNLDAVLVHQSLDSDRVNLSAVNGPGAGYNGPPIDGRANLGVYESGTGGNQEAQITTWNLAWDLPSHRLIYSGAYQDNAFSYDQELDVYNGALNYLQNQVTESSFEVDSHELRLESTAPDLFADYQVGVWYQKTKTQTTFAQDNANPGAFGYPLEPDPVGPPDSTYLLGVSGEVTTDVENIAVYSSTVLHLTDSTDLSIGVRYLENDSERNEVLNFADALIAVGISPGVSIGDAGCTGLQAFAPFTGVESFPGYCDLALDLPQFTAPDSDKAKEWVYQASLQQQFSDDVMAYFTYAHSWRPAGVTVGVTTPVEDRTLIKGEDEESDSYELGLRSEWLDSRLRLNVSIYHQQFDNYIGRFNDIPVLDMTTDQIMTAGFTYPGDATVDGAELDVAFEATDNWWLQLTTAYADGRYDDADVPCRDTNLDGNPDDGDVGNLTPGDFVGNDVIFCSVDSRISTVPEWVTTLQSEVTFPLVSQEGYARVLYNYYSEEQNDGGFEANAYGLLNLYLGLRDPAGEWEVALWARNALDEDTQLDRTDPQTVYDAFPTGYGTVSYVPEREIGVTMRVLFGGG
ncbi:MAG: TonB-dependent receptor [Halioglobus sp.]|nr:TonB-dependent receptor [Halioglobus sp.]